MKTKWTIRLSLILLLIPLSINAQKPADKQWPSFRGYMARGFVDRQNTPEEWNIETGQNILWSRAIPGLGHSCPVIWDDKVFITTAVSGSGEDYLKIGLYGDIDMVDDESVHQFKVYCLDKTSGEIIWEEVAHEGIPITKRHTKSSHANATPATDGKHLVVFFGSEGLYCYSLAGALLWKKDLGRLNAGPYSEENVEWGFGSSPIIHQNRIILQCDVLEGAFLASFDIETGNEIWRTERDEVATWATPTMLEGYGPSQIIVNGWKHMGGYDFLTGKDVWKMSGGGDAPVPAPVVAHDLIFINNAHGRYSPIYVVKPDAQGDITLGNEETTNPYIVWSIKRGGAYMQTPLIYGEYLYNLQGNGSLTCYKATTGEQIYKETIAPRAFTASGIASDNKLYFTSETGEVYVVRAGASYELLAKNRMDDLCMASPAISDGTLFFRMKSKLVAISRKAKK